jgi:hypothetical protein
MQQSGQSSGMIASRVIVGMTGICNGWMQQISDKARRHASDRFDTGRLLAPLVGACYRGRGAIHVGIDAFIVNVAIPIIATELHASAAEIELSFHLIGYGTLVVTGGRFGDRRASGARRDRGRCDHRCLREARNYSGASCRHAAD